MKSVKKLAGILLLMVGFLMLGCGAKAETQSSSGDMAMEAFPSFKTKDLNGNEVTDQIFAQKKITVINIWGTFCPPCIEEMPELAEWSKNMPKDAQIIGIVCDVGNEQDAKTIEAAKSILKEANADFVNLLPNKEIGKYLDRVEAVPTTVFVDSEGKFIGKPVIGADVEGYQKVVKGYLHE